MSTDRTPASSERTAHAGEPSTDVSKVNVSRRALLRGASVALPTILTLHSGAALAAQSSSRYIGTVSKASKAAAPDGRIQCLDENSTVGGTWKKLNLGSKPMLHMQYITPRSYYRAD